MVADVDSGDAGDSSGGAAVHVRCSNGSMFSVRADLDSTVGAFKAILAGKCDVPAGQQRLIYKGRILKDGQTLASYGVESDHTIHLVHGSASPTAAPNTTTANLGASRTPNNTSGVTRGSNEGGGFGGAAFGGSLFPGLGVNGFGGTGASGLFGTGFPEFDQAEQQLTQNPNMMREVMNMPVIQNLMNNPDLMRNLIMNNPQMCEIIDRNPDLAHILNDSSTLRRTLEAARNPELMREMMRNTDRALNNIEASPEGFNMLRRMYETVQEPFLNATTMAGDAGSDLESNPFSTLLGNQEATQSGDRLLNPSSTSSEPTTGSTVPNTNPLPNPWNNISARATNTRSIPAGDARAPSIRSGGLGTPELDQMLMEQSSLLNQVMQNPAMTQMMQTLFSDPQYVNQMLSSHPYMRDLMESNTRFRDTLQNPEFLRQLASPEMMQQVQQSLQSQFGWQHSSQGQNQTGGGTGTPNNTGLELLMNMFGSLGASGLGFPNTPDVPPEQRYATQLSQLQAMGFFDIQENIRALRATSGNVHAAVEQLLGNLG